MDDYEDMLSSDIEKCDEIIRAGFASRDDVWRFVGKYQTIDPHFNEGILTHLFEDNPNEVVNIEIIKGKLQVLLSIKNFSPPPYIQKQGNVNISNANTNTVSSTVSLSIQQTVDVIRENGFLSESDKEDLVEQLKKVEKIQKSEGLEI